MRCHGGEVPQKPIFFCRKTNSIHDSTKMVMMTPRPVVITHSMTAYCILSSIILMDHHGGVASRKVSCKRSIVPLQRLQLPIHFEYCTYILVRGA